MLVTRNEAQATFTLIPQSADEDRKVERVLRSVAPKSRLTYGGRDSDASGRSTRVTFSGFDITVPPAENEPFIDQIRNIAYFGAGLHLLGETTTDNGRIALLVTGGFCKVCGGNIIEWGRSEWATCSACVQKCQHQYEKGAVHGGNVDIGVGLFCGICGVAKPRDPDEAVMMQADRHQAVSDELGILVATELTEEVLLEAIALAKEHARAA
ncbi:MAG: hypothetical protein HZC02_00835 [Candidatus Levybacteria bacterium]|nr:hypothetical protein [Candidatus Levybacteria bacterium]